MDEKFISNQIAVYKTDKKLLELNGKLKLAPQEFYAHVHAESDENANGFRESSRIEMKLLDYSSDVKGSTFEVRANISPASADYIFSRLRTGRLAFQFDEEKIMPGVDPVTGRSRVTKLKIVRTDKNAAGEVMRYPWCVEIENGTAIAAKTGKGGTYIQKGSFVSTGSVKLNLSDRDLYEMFYTVTHFVNNWEAAYVPANIFESEAVRNALIEEKRNQEAG